MRNIFENNYPGAQTVLDEIIEHCIGSYNSHDEDILKNNPSKIAIAKQANILSIKRIAHVSYLIDDIQIFDITLSTNSRLRYSRVNIQRAIRSLLPTYSLAIMFFHYENNMGDWRISFLEKLGSTKESTNAKRHTYLVGKGNPSKTITDRFEILAKINETSRAIEDLRDAFSVEALSKEFFAAYKKQYDSFCQFIYDNKNNKKYFGEEFAHWEDKTVRDYVKKLLGRIVFIYFLQKKNWMGVPINTNNKDEWTGGNPDFLKSLFDGASEYQQDNFLDKVLEPLFFECLNTKRDKDIYDTGIKSIGEKGKVRIPYLNGGLFEQEEIDKPDTVFPAKMFEDLFELFSQYNFTIDENDPSDAEIGVDPEMLGKIFESLLEDNKDKGAFYTPKEIVQYMCRESLIAYLNAETNSPTQPTASAVGNKDIHALIYEHNAENLNSKQKDAILQALKDVKICDPAIGSGAFPMGILNELYRARLALGEDIEQVNIKKQIIKQNIYGVDIEKGAIDIARLRFWLAIVVDSSKPEPLPNFDFKFMQGNSLVEAYKGIDLSEIISKKKGKVNNVDISFFEKEIDIHRNKLANLIGEYYSACDHDRKETILNEIIKGINKQLSTDGRILDLEGIDLRANQHFFLWHTWFSEVFNPATKQDGEAGFDIVIGNPPYISAPTQVACPHLNKQREILSNSGKYTSLHSKWDLYIPFVELGLKLLSKNAVCAFIIPYPMTNQIYAKKLREMIVKDYDLIELADLTGTKIFDNATVSNCIPFVRNAEPNGKLWISNINEQGQIEKVFEKTNIDLVQDEKTYVWNTKNSIRDTKRHDNLTVVGDYCYISVGMVINADEKKAKGEFKKEDLISLTKDNIHCREFIEAKDIDRYIVKRVRFLEYNTERSPDKLRRPTFRELYNKEKLMFNRLGDIKIYYDKGRNFLTSDSMFMAILWKDLKGIENNSINNSVTRYSRLKRSEMEKLSSDIDLRFLLGILNSNYANVLLSNIRGDGLSIYPEHIRNLPIPQATPAQQQPIISLVEQVLAAKALDISADTSALEAEIDAQVYHLYGLNAEEIAVIEGKS